jgi:nitrate reductase (NAD(P)H)
VLHTTEDFIKYKQDWPVNVKKRQEEAEEKKKESEQKEDDSQTPQKEHEWRRGRGENETHHEAHATDSKGNDNKDDSDSNKEGQQSLQDKYSPQELSLLRLLQAESELMRTIQENDGTAKIPIKPAKEQDTSIDETDQFTPDNWIPRSTNLIRLTGKHPLNCEPELTALFDAGLITPNQLHYIRNHGPVPHLLWETHRIDVQSGKLVLSMDDLQDNFEAINIAVALACDGNRRKELNMIRKSKGFNWGAGAISCAFWRGALLCDVLSAAGFDDDVIRNSGVRRWVHFEGADELSEGKYATSIPLAYAMDPENDVILAYEMNDAPLPPDHGYPVRLLIPGFVGGRCVKWLHRIWVSEKQNDSHYHIWDNRVLPSFVRDMDSEFAHTMFHHPSTACNEQNLNSIIVKPEHGETIRLSDVDSNQSYRISGIAYDGGGHEVQRVEVSLDGGETWLYCVRKVSTSIFHCRYRIKPLIIDYQFPEYPVRHGRKFWTWIHWHVDVGLAHLIRAESIVVRCFNVFKNTQPEKPAWNIMG